MRGLGAVVGFHHGVAQFGELQADDAAHFRLVFHQQHQRLFAYAHGAHQRLAGGRFLALVGERKQDGYGGAVRELAPQTYGAAGLGDEGNRARLQFADLRVGVAEVLFPKRGDAHALR